MTSTGEARVGGIRGPKEPSKEKAAMKTMQTKICAFTSSTTIINMNISLSEPFFHPANAFYFRFFLPARQRIILFVPQLRTNLGMAAYLSGTRSFLSPTLSSWAFPLLIPLPFLLKFTTATNCPPFKPLGHNMAYA